MTNYNTTKERVLFETKKKVNKYRKQNIVWIFKNVVTGIEIIFTLIKAFKPYRFTNTVHIRANYYLIKL